MEGADSFDVSNEDFSVVETELESLLAIFIDELSFTKKSDGTVEEIQIQLHPFTGHDTTKQFVCMTLIIRPSSRYPDEIPFFEIRNPRGLGEEEIASLLQDMKLKAQEYVGEPVLYTLIEMARESLTEGNVPHCPCVLCLEFFDSKQAFHRTSCYHYFHSHCLSAYLSHTRNMIKEERVRQEKEGSAHRADKDDQSDVIVCPVCRKNLDEESCSITCEVKPESTDSKFELSDEMRQQQKWMSEVYARQKARGGIIDLEAEKNKFLINQDTVLITTSPIKNEKSKQKDTITPRLDQAKDVQNSDQVRRKGPKGRGRGHTSDRHFDKTGGHHGQGRPKDKKLQPNKGQENFCLNKNGHKFDDAYSQSGHMQVSEDYKNDKNFPNYQEITRTVQRPEIKHSESLQDESKLHYDRRKEKQNVSRRSDDWSYEKKEDTQQSNSRHRGYKGRSLGEQRNRHTSNTEPDSEVMEDQQLAKDLQNHQINQKWRQKNFGKQKPANDKPIRFAVYDDDEDEKAQDIRNNHKNMGCITASLHTDNEAINDFKLAIDNSEYNCWEEEIDEYAFQHRHVRAKNWDQYKNSRKTYEKQLDETLKERVERERTLLAEERRMRNEAEQKRAKAEERMKSDNSKPVKSILDQFKEQKKQKIKAEISSNHSSLPVTDHLVNDESVNTDNKQIEVGAGAKDEDIQWIRDSKKNSQISGDVEKKFGEQKLEPILTEKNYQEDKVDFQRKVSQGRPNRHSRGGRHHRQTRDDYSETASSHYEKYPNRSDDKPREREYNSRNQTRRHHLSDRRDCFNEPVGKELVDQKECKYISDSNNDSAKIRRDRKPFQPDHHRNKTNKNLYDDNYNNLSQEQSDIRPDSRNRTFEAASDRIRCRGHERNNEKLVNENQAVSLSNSQKSETSELNLGKDHFSNRNYSKQVLQGANDFVDNGQIAKTSSDQASASLATETSATHKSIPQAKDTKFKKAKPLDFTKRRGQSGSKKTSTVPPPGL